MRTAMLASPALPAEHFAAAFVAFVLAAAGLVPAAEHLAAGAYLAFPVIGVAHLFTLGFVTTSIMGVLYQFLPVGIGVGIKSQRVAHLTFALWVPGVLLFAGGTIVASHATLRVGVGLVSVAVVLFVTNLWATLVAAPHRNITWWGLAVGGTNLFLVLVLGALLALNLGSGHLGASRMRVTAAHAHLALLGWVMPVVVGVGHRLLPMFLLAPGADRRPSAAAVALLGIGAPLLAVALGAGHRPAALAGALLGFSGLLAFVLQVALYLGRRRLPALDPAMRAAMAGVVALALAAASAPAVVVTAGGAPRLLTGYGLLAVLGLSLFVVGHYYRIVPHFVWRHRYAPTGGCDVPRPEALIARRPAALAVALLAAGAASLAGGAFALGPPVVLARSGAFLFAAGAVVVAVQMAALASGRVRKETRDAT